ncbi:DUF4180 domain-containing protein [Roseivirga pacifica]|uniref:DUF4180 domain-containing protein n=1 Tax=Roseivirga pacifica TaxID=1267423 RepID=UPI002095626E|nr:DUF4180 domain-containing protein [Roseivirga pacifica]MCO6357360.1 DUF4180 domain-containing protein [Roseivirga pacifica]MCO6367926.1 DUF4180 domain-containing protein [Roseivirga pacifica]MCO6369592.1 DUF4180 domain-containing protein [Roseivirga pacifica]MCO6373446.1 DUF4180 domain-containing protein [Roseivirga pacifica]MCO6377297.1 DUF4180 domain-containing protein [Roseivirga pacifica]
MQTITHKINNSTFVEVLSDELVINTIEDGADLLANLYYQGFDGAILYQQNITPTFFDLKTKMAGELLQKASNFRMRVIIIGDFENIESKSLQDFIKESNRGSLVNFVSSLSEVTTPPPS